MEVERLTLAVLTPRGIPKTSAEVHVNSFVDNAKKSEPRPGRQSSYIAIPPHTDNFRCANLSRFAFAPEIGDGNTPSGPGPAIPPPDGWAGGRQPDRCGVAGALRRITRWGGIFPSG